MVALPRFVELVEFQTLDGKIVPFEQWPMSLLLKGHPQRGRVLKLRRLDQVWERTFSYNGGVVRDTGGSALVFLTITDVTEQMSAEAKLRTSLRENLDLYAALDEHAIVARTDALGRIVFVNDKFCALSGYSREELLGNDYRLMESQHHSPAFMQAIWEAVGSGKAWNGEIKNRAKGGQFYWVDTTIMPFLNENGVIRQYVAICVDITERKAVEEALENNRRLLSELVEYSGSLVFVKDKAGRYQLVNRQWEQITGMAREQIINRTDEEVFPPDEARRFREVDEQVMAAGEALTVEEKLALGSEVRHFLSVKFPLRSVQGEVIGLCGMSTEITAHYEAQEKLRQQAELLDNARDAILVRDLEHRITYWNKGAERVYSWTAEEAIGQSVRELLYSDPTEFLKATAHAVEFGEWIGEIQQRGKDGRAMVVEGHWTLVRDEAGEPKAILAINTDVTERKKLEQQFMRAQRVESIGTLAGGIAHDLNNVLGPIILSLDLLKMRFPDRDSRELISVISSSAHRGAEMVRQVLSFARGMAGQRSEVQLKHTVKDIEKIINETFLKHVRVVTDLPGDLMTVSGDATQLHQVLLNLCVNARDAMPDGGTLTISAEDVTIDDHYAGLAADAKPGRYVALEVKDTGTGMSPEVVEKVFDPFFTTKEVGKGTGLGLSTTLAIVKSHGGFIRIYSEVGRGTKFRVYLPASQESASATGPVEAQFPRGRGERVLLVDDEASVRQITQQTLEAFGYKVLLACDGAEALALAAPRLQEIDLVLTDLTMPIMDGPALIQVLQRMAPNLPIVAASGLAEGAQGARVTAMGVKHLLAKPYSSDKLLVILRDALEEKRSARAS